MKTAPRFYQDNPETVLAFQKPDYEANRDIFERAESLWHNEWLANGAKDEGSCCLGKGIEAWYVGPRKRTAVPTLVVACNWVQGNVAASRYVEPALEHLRSAFPEIEFRYNDGRMD